MQISLRRTLTVAAIGLTLLLPAASQAHSASASSGGVKATLSYTGGPGITTKRPVAIAAWAGDEYLLGTSHRATVQTLLRRQQAEHHLTLAFVKSLDKLLARHP